MKVLKQEIYFPIIIGIHFLFWAIDLHFYQGGFREFQSDTLIFGELTDTTWFNIHRVLGEVFSSWVVTVFAFNFLMATRAKWVERMFGGLDKMYLIHRRSAIIAVCLLVAHFVVVPRDAVFSIGKPLGFYAMGLILIGVFISAAPIMKRWIPYNKWIYIHKLMGLFYVLAVIHAFTVNSLIKELPITRVYVFGMSMIGVLAWFYKAFLFNIFNKKIKYSVKSVMNRGNGTTDLLLTSNGDKLKYEAGQFAFFTFPSISKREQHPFTISSSPNEENLRVSVKGLGDYTDHLSDKLSENDEALVEGPYGLFVQSQIKEQDQMWIAGGIGITPFLALSKEITNQNVTLYWAVRNTEEAIYAQELQQTALENPNFTFILWPSEEKGHLSIDKTDSNNLPSKAFLICGPDPLKKSFIHQLKKLKVKASQIHDEEFAFR